MALSYHRVPFRHGGRVRSELSVISGFSRGSEPLSRLLPGPIFALQGLKSEHLWQLISPAASHVDWAWIGPLVITTILVTVISIMVILMVTIRIN